MKITQSLTDLMMNSDFGFADSKSIKRISAQHRDSHSQNTSGFLGLRAKCYILLEKYNYSYEEAVTKIHQVHDEHMLHNASLTSDKKSGRKHYKPFRQPSATQFYLFLIKSEPSGTKSSLPFFEKFKATCQSKSPPITNTRNRLLQKQLMRQQLRRDRYKQRTLRPQKHKKPDINSDKTKTVVSFLAIIINETVNESSFKNVPNNSHFNRKIASKKFVVYNNDMTSLPNKKISSIAGNATANKNLTPQRTNFQHFLSCIGFNEFWQIVQGY